jgi:hypothetical protein
MKRQYLVKFQADYADEFDVYGFTVMTENQYIQFRNDLEKVEWPSENYFGTNEAIVFQSLKDYENAIEVIEIDEKEYQVLEKLFGGGYMGVSFGSFIDPGEY